MTKFDSELYYLDSDGHNRNKHTAHSSEAQSNAATDNESDHRSETGDSFTQTNNEVSHAIMQVTKKVRSFSKIASAENEQYRNIDIFSYNGQPGN